MNSLLTYLLILVYFITSVSGIIKLRLLDKQFKKILFLLLVITIQELATKVLMQFGIYQNYTTHAFCLILPFLFYRVYESVMKNSKLMAIAKLILVLGLFAYCIIFITVNDLDKFPTILVNLSQLQIIIFTGLYFLDLLDHPNSIPPSRDAIFLFNAATFIYYSTSYFIFTIPYFLIENNIDFNITGMINIILCLIYYPMHIYFFYLNTKRNEIAIAK